MAKTNKENVQSWRKRTKERLVEAFGGKCAICSYCKSIEALQFHHLDPNGKDFGISSAVTNIKSWNSIISEARKCIMVCANCHAEIHAEVTIIPENVTRFDESFSEYRKTDFGQQDACPVCQSLKPSNQTTCSRSCAAQFRPKFDWSEHDLASLIQGRSVLSVAQELGVSDAAVTKRLKKLGLR